MFNFECDNTAGRLNTVSPAVSVNQLVWQIIYSTITTKGTIIFIFILLNTLNISQTISHNRMRLRIPVSTMNPSVITQHTISNIFLHNIMLVCIKLIILILLIVFQNPVLR